MFKVDSMSDQEIAQSLKALKWFITNAADPKGAMEHVLTGLRVTLHRTFARSAVSVAKADGYVGDERGVGNLKIDEDGIHVLSVLKKEPHLVTWGRVLIAYHAEWG